MWLILRKLSVFGRLVMLDNRCNFAPRFISNIVMPFIISRTNCDITRNQELQLKSRLGKAISLVPGKSEQYLLLGFEPNFRPTPRRAATLGSRSRARRGRCPAADGTSSRPRPVPAKPATARPRLASCCGAATCACPSAADGWLSRCCSA